jgi:formylglycine-generating enzyme required for sulfatase activity
VQGGERFGRYSMIGLAESTRAAGRSRLKRGEIATNIGFRCARSLP